MVLELLSSSFKNFILYLFYLYLLVVSKVLFILCNCFILGILNVKGLYGAQNLFLFWDHISQCTKDHIGFYKLNLGLFGQSKCPIHCTNPLLLYFYDFYWLESTQLLSLHDICIF